MAKSIKKRALAVAGHKKVSKDRASQGKTNFDVLKNLQK